MFESNSRSQIFSIDKRILLLIESYRLAGWDIKKRVLLFDITGQYAGVSEDHKILCVKSGQILHFYNLPTGRELDSNGVQATAFAEHQRAIITGKPNSDTLIVEDVFTGQTRNILLQGKLSFDPPLRVYPTPYVVARTWYDTGYVEGENLECYNLETGRQVFCIPSNGNCTFQVTGSNTQKALAIEECGRISVHDLVTGGLRISIIRPTPVNLSYRIRRSAAGEYKEYIDELGKVVEDPQPVSSISLHPQKLHLIAIAAGKNILLIDSSFPIHDIFKNWSSGKVAHTFQGRSNIAGIAFISDGEKIASVTEEGKLDIWDVPESRSY